MLNTPTDTITVLRANTPLTKNIRLDEHGNLIVESTSHARLFDVSELQVGSLVVGLILLVRFDC